MFFIHMLGRLCRRTYDMITATGVLAVLVLMEQPLYLYSSSFLLSFGCVLAIALLFPAFTVKTQKGKLQNKQSEARRNKLAGAVTVTIAMLPLQLLFFYQIPLYSVLLNLLVIPMMSLLLPAGMLLLVLGSMAVYLGNCVACFGEGWHEVVWFGIKGLTMGTQYLITGILAFYDLICSLCNKLPFSFLCIGSPDLWRVVCYFVILIVIVLLQKKLSVMTKWLFVGMGILLLVWPSSGTCSVTFLDVGQGDGIHIQSKSGNHYLIDGGSSSVSGVGEYRILPYLRYHGITEIEAVFITHGDEDHCNGILELISLSREEGVSIKRLCLPDINRQVRGEAYQRLEKTAASADIPVVYFSEGMVLQDGDLCMQCLHPYEDYFSRNENEYSLVLLLQYQDFDVLFTGDVEGEGEEELVRVLRELQGSADDGKQVGGKEFSRFSVEVLKVAHHGSRNSTSEELLQLIHPKIAVISCGENNSYGHPHKETLNRLEEVGAMIMKTPDYGAITVEFGSRIKVYGYLD